jgi:acyl carrier protein
MIGWHFSAEIPMTSALRANRPEPGASMTDPLVQLFADVLEVDPAKLNDYSSPDNVEQWDSLIAMKLVAAIEEKFNIKLSTREIVKMSTIGRARQTLQNKKVIL